jgi:hypothetical protein
MLETFALKRTADIFRGVGEGLNFDGLIGASKGAAPSPRARVGVHIRNEYICARSPHPRQLACQHSRVEDVTDGKRAHNNIRHSCTKRKRKAISQDEVVSKKRLAGGTADHLGARIYPYH